MPGFLGEFNAKSVCGGFEPNTDQALINDSIESEGLYLERRALNKFGGDKVFLKSARGVMLLDGVIVNKHELIKRLGVDTLEEALWHLYDTMGSGFMAELRGTFSGALYDRKRERLLIFADHIGTHQVFYAECADSLIFGSEVKYLSGFFKNNDQKYSLDKVGAYLLLTYGFMQDSHTLLNEVKRLEPGTYLQMDSDGIAAKRFYKLPKSATFDGDEQAIVDEVDIRFRDAIQRQFEKDNEYGYKHLVALSGGLDSRMTACVAHDMGYTRMLNFTFSESDYLDESIPKEIARDLKHEWLFKALDNGLFLRDIDAMTRLSEGKCSYNSLAHSMSILEYLDFNQLGIVHSGQLGDVILGTYCSKSGGREQAFLGDGAASLTLLHRLDHLGYRPQYDDFETYKLMGRGLLGINQGLIGAQSKTETLSPFYDIDFLDFALSIPVSQRLHHRIYKMWITRYPHTCNYVWEKSGVKPLASTLRILGREFYWKNVWRKLPELVLRKAGLWPRLFEMRKHMNPYQYWYANNNDLRKSLDTYFDDHISLLDGCPELQGDCIQLYRGKQMTEKFQVISLLSALKLFF